MRREVWHESHLPPGECVWGLKPGSQGKELSETLCLSVVSVLAELTLLAANSSQLAASWETVNPSVSAAVGVG